MLIAPKEYCFWSRSLRIFGNAATITNGKSASEPKALTIMLIIVGFKAFLSTQGQQRKHFIRQSCPCASWFGYNLDLRDGNKHVLAHPPPRSLNELVYYEQGGRSGFYTGN